MTGRGVADDAAGEGAGNLLEEHLSVLILEAGRGMLIQLGRFGMESKEVFAGMIFIIGNLTGNGPEVAVDVEKVHIHGNLDAVPFQVFLLVYLVYNNYFSVCYGGDQVFLVRRRDYAVRYAEKPGDEHHEDNHEGA
jgi:hypothetical protein